MNKEKNTMNAVRYPYSDEYMVFDEKTNRYVLTEKYILDAYGIDLQSIVNDRNAINPQAMSERVLRMVSNAVYNEIHKYNVNTQVQDQMITYVPSARDKIQRAMAEQFLYFMENGDLSRSTLPEKRALSFDKNALAVLEEVLPELGISLLYTGYIGGFGRV
jgi:hypothetical protein